MIYIPRVLPKLKLEQILLQSGNSYNGFQRKKKKSRDSRRHKSIKGVREVIAPNIIHNV